MACAGVMPHRRYFPSNARISSFQAKHCMVMQATILFLAWLTHACLCLRMCARACCLFQDDCVDEIVGQNRYSVAAQERRKENKEITFVDPHTRRVR